MLIYIAQSLFVSHEPPFTGFIVLIRYSTKTIFSRFLHFIRRWHRLFCLLFPLCLSYSFSHFSHNCFSILQLLSFRSSLQFIPLPYFTRGRITYAHLYRPPQHVLELVGVDRHLIRNSLYFLVFQFFLSHLPSLSPFPLYNYVFPTYGLTRYNSSVLCTTLYSFFQP